MREWSHCVALWRCEVREWLLIFLNSMVRATADSNICIYIFLDTAFYSSSSSGGELERESGCVCVAL